MKTEQKISVKSDSRRDIRVYNIRILQILEFPSRSIALPDFHVGYPKFSGQVWVSPSIASFWARVTLNLTFSDTRTPLTKVVKRTGLVPIQNMLSPVLISTPVILLSIRSLDLGSTSLSSTFLPTLFLSLLSDSLDRKRIVRKIGCPTFRDGKTRVKPSCELFGEAAG